MKKTILRTATFLGITSIILAASASLVSAVISRLDTAFNSIGYVTHDNAAGGSGDDQGYSVQVQSDGKYVVAGYSKNAGGNLDLAVWRFNADSTLDTTFNSTGYAIHDNAAGGSDDDYGRALQIQSDGKYVISGYSTRAGGNFDLAIWRYNTNGTLDATFNATGYVTHHGAAGGNGEDGGYSLQIQSDGKYVVSGYSTNAGGNLDLAVWRYNTNGTLDTTFNATGYATHHNAAGGNGWDGGFSLQVQSDGKYVIAGYSRCAGGNYDLAVWRYNTNGTLDTTFNATGYATHDNAAGGSDFDGGFSLQIQSDGKYVISGYSTNAGGNWDLAVWRYNVNGTLDTTFNSTGYVTHHGAAGGNGSDGGSSLKIQSDGKYVVAGHSRSAADKHDLTIWRYNADGTLDTTFNSTGYITHDSAAGGNDDDYGIFLQIQSDGKYVVTGYSKNVAGNYDLAIWRYENLYQIADLDSSLDVAINSHNIEVGGANGTYGTQTLTISTTGNIPIASIVVDMYVDQTWSSVTGNVDLANFASIIIGGISAPGTADTFALYVPYRTGDNTVGICDGVTDISRVNTDCAALSYMYEEDSNVSIVEIDGSLYWQILGVSSDNIGGFSTIGATQRSLPQTSTRTTTLSILSAGAILTASGAVLAAKPARKRRLTKFERRTVESLDKKRVSMW